MTGTVVVVLGYLIGSFPTGYVLARVVVGADLRAVGSGGTGATNARRVLGSRWGVAIAVIDLVKGILAVAIARVLGADDLAVALAGVAVVAGHCWPVWLGFRGGKGVATGAGAAIAMSPWGLLLVPVMVVPVILTRYVSLGSICAALAAPPLFVALSAADRTPPTTIVFAVLAAAIVLVRHRENISRLRSGTERKLGRVSAQHVP
jgi:glycerol-3-phosphate acyltransferase PlsY